MTIILCTICLRRSMNYLSSDAMELFRSPNRTEYQKHSEIITPLLLNFEKRLFLVGQRNFSVEEVAGFTKFTLLFF